LNVDSMDFLPKILKVPQTLGWKSKYNIPLCRLSLFSWSRWNHIFSKWPCK
jgi:hypothetical protein